MIGSMIYFARATPAGNAVELFLRPPMGTERWRVLRKDADTFTGWNDPEAAVVIETRNENTVADVYGLVNGQSYYYRAYYWNGTTWSASPTVSVMVGLSFIEVGPDPQLFLRQRIDDGLRALIARGDVSHPNGHIQVLVGMPAINDVTLPVVTITMENEQAADRSVGDRLSAGEFDVDEFEWDDVDGWLSRVSVSVSAWTFNAEERINLRRAIRSIVIANLGLFESAGLQMVEFAQNDIDDPATYAAPMYISKGVFTCSSASGVTYNEGAITEVVSEIGVVPAKVGPMVYPPV